DLLRGGVPSAGAAGPPVVLGDPDFGEGNRRPDALIPPRPKSEFRGRLWTGFLGLVTLGLFKSVRGVHRRRAPGGQQGHRLTQFQPVPGARPEAEQIAELFGVRAWLGEEAQKSRLAACRSPRVLHLATQAFALGDPPGENVRPTDAAPE